MKYDGALLCYVSINENIDCMLTAFILCPILSVSPDAQLPLRFIFLNVYLITCNLNANQKLLNNAYMDQIISVLHFMWKYNIWSVIS
jgi:hypothetical protein